MRRLAAGIALAILVAGGVALASLFAGYLDAARPLNVLEHSASIRADNALIAEVEVRLSRPGRVFVEYENRHAGKFRTALSEERAAHLIPVARLRTETTYSYAIGVQGADGAVHLAQGGEFRTRALPPELAAMLIRANGRSSHPLILTDYKYKTNIGDNYILLWDDVGNIVWYYVHKLVKQCGRQGLEAIKQTREGNLVYLSSYCTITEITPLGEIVHQLVTDATTGKPHHDFVLLDNGRILYLSSEQTVFDNSANGGEAETPVAVDTLHSWEPQSGRVHKVWDSRDFWDIASVIHRNEWLRVRPEFTWTHINSLSFGLHGNILLSSRNLSQILSVSADFQTIEWRLGGSDSDYSFPNPNDQFYGQHQATELPNGNILLFDNGTWRPASEGGGRYSRAIEILLDNERRSAVKAWEYRADPDIFSKAVSGVERLSNGNTLVNFGIRQDFDSMPLTFVEVDPQGNQLFRVETLQFRMGWESRFRFRPLRFRASGGIDSILGETMLRAPARVRTEASVPGDRRSWEVVTQRYREQRTNQYRLLHESLVSGALGAPLVRSTLDIYLNGNRLIYLKQPCAKIDMQANIFLHVFPVDEGDLPPRHKQFGFDNLDFDFDGRGEFLDVGCIAQRLLPTYPIDRIRTGQFTPPPDGKQLWQAEFPIGFASSPTAPRNPCGKTPSPTRRSCNAPQISR